MIAIPGTRTAEESFHSPDPNNVLVIDDYRPRSGSAFSSQIEVSLKPAASRLKPGHSGPV
jgi:hypothetical protein